MFQCLGILFAFPDFDFLKTSFMTAESLRAAMTIEGLTFTKLLLLFRNFNPKL